MTRIGIPVASPKGLASMVNDHFAMSEDFAILGVKDDRILSLDFFRNAQDKTAADFLVERGVDVVLAGRIGSCMIRIFQARGVRMFSGAEGTVEEAFESYKAGKLAEVRPSPYQL